MARNQLNGGDADLLTDRSAVRRRSAQGIAISFSAQMVRFVLQFAVSVVMARLLGPSEFGILAMAAPVLAIVYLFSDLGLSQAIIQRSTISQAQLSLVFWAGLIVSCLAGMIVILGARFAADFYHEPRLSAVLMALGVTLMLSGLYNQHLALLNRRLRFGALAVVDLGAFTISAVAGIAAAWHGFSYWSLVINQAASSVATLALAWTFARWLPSRPAAAENAKELLGFGGNITSFNLFNYFARNLDNILIGRALGEAQLGIYDRAYKLLLLPLSQITGPIARVATPLLSRLIGDPVAYARSYLLLVEIILLLTYPGIVVVGIASSLVIVTVLGPQWAAAGPVFQVLAVGGLFAPISNSTGWLFMTQNRTGEMRNLGLYSSAAFVTSFVVGLPWGIQGVATAYIAVGCVQGPLIWYAATRKGPVRFNALLTALYPYLLSILLSGTVVVLLLHVLKPGWAAIVVLLALGYAAFWGTMAAIPSGRKTIAIVINEAIRLVRRE